jgi:hypothetical protein
VTTSLPTAARVQRLLDNPRGPLYRRALRRDRGRAESPLLRLRLPPRGETVVHAEIVADLPDHDLAGVESHADR